MAATKTRKISDLFRRGEELELNDGQYNAKVWLQKLNPIESETAVRRANAARAKFMLSVADRESETYLSLLNEVVDYTPQELVEFLAAQDIAQRMEALESEYAETKDWNKDDYLQGLNDAWTDELEERYLTSQAEGIPDPEAEKCFEELTSYQKGLEQLLLAEQETATLVYQNRTSEELRDQVVERMFKLQADVAWLGEYRKCEIWMGTRVSKTDHTKAFEQRREIDDLPAETINLLVEGFLGLSVPVLEGKGSQATATSSRRSKRHETQETEPSSGPVDATV